MLLSYLDMFYWTHFPYCTMWMVAKAASFPVADEESLSSWMAPHPDTWTSKSLRTWIWWKLWRFSQHGFLLPDAFTLTVWHVRSTLSLSIVTMLSSIVISRCSFSRGTSIGAGLWAVDRIFHQSKRHLSFRCTMFISEVNVFYAALN